MLIWIHRDSRDDTYDICEHYGDAIGPDFVQVDVDEALVGDFAKAQIVWNMWQTALHDLWEGGFRGAHGKDSV